LSHSLRQEQVERLRKAEKDANDLLRTVLRKTAWSANAGSRAGARAVAAGGVISKGQTFTVVNERYSAQSQEGSLLIFLRGSLADGRVWVGSIRIVDSGVVAHFSHLEDLPETYQVKVRELIDGGGKEGVTIRGRGVGMN
jgi:hypothetical protein